jgi:uncharacterized protein YecE (DUF72 family)
VRRGAAAAALTLRRGADMIRYGPAGWSYDDWKGVVYPADAPRGFDPLGYLADYFDTVEINSSFYGPPRPKTSAAWAERVRGHPDFRFTAKLYRRFTHDRKTAWTQAEVDEVRAGLDPLSSADRLGALLLQFPWSFRRTEENREWLGDLTTVFREYPLVLEVRHESWNEPDFFADLAARGIGFVNIDQPLFSDSIAPSARATSRVGYVRVHGRNYQDWWRKGAGVYARYDYLYPAAELKPWAERVEEIAEKPETEDVYVVTNNHARGKAVANALMLNAMVEGKPVEAPPPLVEEYPAELKPYVSKPRRKPRKAG